MNAQTIAQVARGTLDGSISFPGAVAQLLGEGVEYYHVDYVALKKSFYSGDGTIVSTSINFEGLPAVAAEFSHENLRSAIRDSQSNGQSFRDFTDRAMKAGVQGYYAFLPGRRVTYLGKR